MAGRYYEAEHFVAYARIRGAGLSRWNDLHEDRPGDYDDFDGRAFLERVLPTGTDHRGMRALEYGCGTGAAACFLARRGFAVTAVDLVPDAIALARRFAAERGLVITFAVQDVCRWTDDGDHCDLVLDNLCLQSIVTDDDRSRLLGSVRRRLVPEGRFLINTAMHQPGRDYGDDHRDPDTGIVWAPVPTRVPDAELIDRSWHLPNRRHLTPDALRAELERHGFEVLEQAGRLGGELVCAPGRDT